MFRWFIPRVKWTVTADVAMFVAHLLLVTVLIVLFVEVINNAFFYSDLGKSFLSLSFRSADLDIDFGAERAEIWVEALLATYGMSWVKCIEWLHIELT